MPAGPADIGISSASETLLQNIEWTGALDEKMRMNKDGGFAKANAFDLKITGTLKVLGDSEVELGVAAAGISGVEDGITVFTEKTHTQVQDDYDETDLSFENAPSAETGAP